MSIDREKALQAAQKYVEKKKYDRAIAEYQRVIQEDPNDARTLLKIGDLQARLQAYPEAIATYDRVGLYYASQGFALKAIAVYKQIRELIKKHAPALADRYGHIVPKLAEIYTQLGLTSDALAAYDEVATRLQRGGRDREAIDVFRRMVELDPSNPLPHLRLAEACCRVQSLDEAITLFWRAAELLLGLGRREDALKVVERILHFRVDPRYARVAAELYLERGSREDGLQALAKLQVCFQADPRDLDTLGLLARAFQLIGQEAKALEVYKEMARLAREQGKPDLYKQLLKHLRQIAGDDEGVRQLESIRPSTNAPPSSLTSPSSLSPGTYTSPGSISSPSSAIPISLADSAVEALEEQTGRSTPGKSVPEVALIDDGPEIVQEVGAAPASSFDARAHARKAIVDADSFRRLRLYPKAIETLHIALEIEPRSLEIRGKLRELLIESGDREGAITETVNLAALHLDRAELPEAEALLREVVEVEPTHAAALAMLEQVSPGAVIVSETTNSGTTGAGRNRPALDTFDPDAPLPSYDLEEVGADQALHRGTTNTTGPKLLVVDEPFGADEARALPRYAASDEGRSGSLGSMGSIVDLEDISVIEDPVPAAARVSPEMEALEEALDEAEFFVARGLLEDARTILSEQLAKSPNHPLVLERLREVEESLAASGSSQTIERSMLGAAASAPAVSEVDVAASLGVPEHREPNPQSLSGEGVTSSMVEVDVDQVFAKFKAGVRAQVVEADSATHYDLGVAYKEMGLVTEAISEFEQAGLDPHRECMCYAMIGLIYLEQNQLDRSAESYVKALSAQAKTVEQEMNLYYDLGTVYEMKGATKDALYYFQKIARRDPGYRDVSDRLNTLDPGSSQPKPTSSARAVNDDDDFDRAFDDLFEGKGS
ncbi:MAG TPA: tetratricopeptide repeat protein [Polyangiaceae bacterium]|nr:tetratricopeptide repeat protein [Polyangiaceae bacterium]